MSAVALQSFGFGDHLVRVIDRTGEAWFVANDVCRALEIGNSRDAVGRLEEDEKGVVSTDTLGGAQQMTIISESGVYALIFTSRKAAAKAFRRWVTQEVLPAIRRTGRYETANDDRPRQGRVLDLEGALGTQDDRHAIKTALLTVQMYTDLYGQQAGRDMMAKLGFPVPEVDLPAAPSPAQGGARAVEGDIHAWGAAAGIKASKRDATHVRELFEHYSRWCSACGSRPMHPDRFKAMIVTIFGHEEHPEMICAVVTRRAA